MELRQGVNEQLDAKEHGPPSHQGGKRIACVLRDSTVIRAPTIKRVPATSQVHTRPRTCGQRAAGSRGRSQLRKRSSTQWPPKENHNANAVHWSQDARWPERTAMTHPTASPTSPVRTNVARKGSW